MDCFTSFAMTLFRELVQINKRASLRAERSNLLTTKYRVAKIHI